MSLNGNFKISTNLINTKDNVDLSTPIESVVQTTTKSITTGVLYHDAITLSASEILTLDIGNDSLSDVYGQTVALTGVTGLYAKANASNTADILLSGGANAFLSNSPALGAGEGVAYLANFDVSTNSKIYVINQGAVSGQILDLIVAGDE